MENQRKENLYEVLLQEISLEELMTTEEDSKACCIASPASPISMHCY